MILALLLAAAGIALFAFGLLRGSRDASLRDRRARWTLRAALALLAAFAGFWAFFGIGEMAEGDASGAAHLIPAAIIVLLMLAVRRRPREGGIVLMVVGTLVAISALGAYRGGWPRYIGVALVTGVPLVASGILLIAASSACTKPTIPPPGSPDA